MDPGRPDSLFRSPPARPSRSAGCGGERYSVGLESTVLAATIDYQCEGGTSDARRALGRARACARVTIGDRQWTLTRAPTAPRRRSTPRASTCSTSTANVAMHRERRPRDRRPVPVQGRDAQAPTLRPYDFRSPNF
jgi:hypothetical protein